MHWPVKALLPYVMTTVVGMIRILISVNSQQPISSKMLHLPYLYCASASIRLEY